MPWYFMVDIYMEEQKGRGAYDEYIRQVKPIVERFGGEYLARTEQVDSLSETRAPQRVILIRFDTRERLEACFSSAEYRAIMAKRSESVDSRAIIVEGIR